ncbi:MAG: FKBP-type peptidyl-prolyl cis-trans isomerase [Saprospiraceae bacterium]
MKNKLWLFAAMLLLVSACNKEEEPEEPDNVTIERFVAENNLNTTVHPSGIHYIITKTGTGANPTINATINVRYKGYFLDGSVFDQVGSGVEFPLKNLIEGWKIAVPLLQKGGKGTFIIPSALGYGANPPPGIPRNAILIFDIELIDFKE